MEDTTIFHRPDTEIVAHIPFGVVLDPRLARLFSEARRLLGRPLTEAESRALLIERAKLN